MAKQRKHSAADKAAEPVIEQVESLEQTIQETVEETEPQQAVSNDENFAKNSENVTACNEPTEKEDAVTDTIETEQAAPAAAEPKKQKSGGTAIALLALLVAVGLGGFTYYHGHQKFAEVESRLTKLQQAAPQAAANIEMPNFEAEKAQIAQLTGDYQKALAQIAQLEQQQGNYTQQINQLQLQLQKLGATPKAEPAAWLLSDADFLLTNAVRKVVLDNDIDTAKSLLIEADKVLSQVSDPQILSVREAIKGDLNTLSSLNKVDQNNIMQRLAQLANLVDDMPMLDNEQLASKESGEVSDSLDDWQQNIEKSADSFLSHFIRVSDKKQAQDKAFIAPNQEIYLRENIRLRLQIAILAVPRQQNELYKQSLEAISTWVRSYFDVQSDSVKHFLKEVDDFIEQSIYIDAPNKLQSFELLKQKLNRSVQAVEKIELEVDKAVEQLKIEPQAEQPAEQPAAQPKTEPQQ